MFSRSLAELYVGPDKIPGRSRTNPRRHYVVCEFSLSLFGGKGGNNRILVDVNYKKIPAYLFLLSRF